MRTDSFTQILNFLNQLDQGQIHYALEHPREAALMITVAVPGERWEVEFLEDGSIEVERFISNGEIYGSEVLAELFARFGGTRH